MTLQIIENQPLAPLTTMGIGGPARKFVKVHTVDDLIEALNLAKTECLPVFVLGAGSNTLICDEGFDGLVIQPAMDAMIWNAQPDGSTLVTIGAGVPFDDVVAESCRRNLGGIESLSGIPGSAGGSLVQNIGAYGQEISEVFVSAEAVSKDDLSPVTLTSCSMDFGYRHTALKRAENGLIISSITLRLAPFDAEKAAERCSAHGFTRIAISRPKTAMDLRSVIIKTRAAKAMCYDKYDTNTHSVGSFFINPIVSQQDAQRINAASIIRTQKPIPSYPAENGRIKLSAAWLIQDTGYSKGYCYKGTGLSEQHCLAIINRGNASAAEVVEFAIDIAKHVYLKFRIELIPEVVYLMHTGIMPLPLNTKEVEFTGMPIRPNPLPFQ